MSTLSSEPGASTIRGPRRGAPPGFLAPASRGATLTLGGVMYIVVTLFLAIGAINAQNNLLFWLFGVAIALLITSGIFSGNALLRVRCKGDRIVSPRVGQAHTIRYELASTSRVFPLFGILIYEKHSGPSGFRGVHPGVLTHLSPRGRGVAAASILFERRGHQTLDSFRVESSFPFGVIRKWIRFDQHRSFVVLPWRLELLPGLVLSQMNEGGEIPTRVPRRGQGSEFLGLREYAPGDSRRKIAWKQSARRGGLVVVEHAVEDAPRVILRLRRPTQADDPARVECAIALLCSVAHQAIGQGLAVGVWIPWGKVRLAPAPGEAQLNRIEQALALLDLQTASNAQETPPKSWSGRAIEISCTAGTDDDPGAVLSADRPQGWLKPGAEIPAGLIASGVRQ